MSSDRVVAGPAYSGSKTVKITIPASIAKMLNVKFGDIIQWHVGVEGNPPYLVGIVTKKLDKHDLKRRTQSDS